MRIALGQINPTVGDFAGNLRKIAATVDRAADLGAELVVLPELATCGYPPADLLEKPGFVREAERTLAALAELSLGSQRPAILCGSPMSGDSLASDEPPSAGRRVQGKNLYNTAVLLEDGRQTFVQRKRLLPYYDVFDEQRYFEPATQQSLAVVKGRAVAITICEDAWNDKMFWPRQMYPVDPVEDLMRQWATLPQPLSGQRLILNLSASPFWHGKAELRREMMAALARRHNAAVVLVNQVGANDSLIFDGASFALDGRGQVRAQARSFAEDIVLVDTAADTPAASAPPHLHPLPGPVESMADALVLGTRDYVHKCGFTRAIVGLSGGIDSAVVAALAVQALGAANVLGVGMPSEYSSAGSLTDAAALAQQLGIPFQQIPIQGIHTELRSALEPVYAALGASPAFGLAEENVQPRIRGTLLMALSNKTGALVLTTGNKSEMACGYCTLYGDMVGALAVIGDLYKTEVYQLARHLNRHAELIPESTLIKPPSAELRPGQKDSDSLPIYDELDPILRAYIEEFATAEEIAQQQGVELETVRRVLRLVELSEYKRQQAAPVLKVSRKSFGTGRRFPIAARRM